MNSKRKWLLLPTTLITTLAPVAAVIGCKSHSAENSNLVLHPSKSVYAVLDGLGQNGKDSFSDLASQAAIEYFGNRPNVLIPKSSSASDIKSEYSKVPTGSIILASGYSHIDAIDKNPKSIEGKNLILIDGSVLNEKVLSIKFEVEEAAYLAGYSLAEYVLKPEGFNALKGDDDQVVVSTFGGDNIEQVTGFMAGFKNGFNAALTSEKNNILRNKISFFTFKNEGEHFSGSFQAGGAKPLIDKFKVNKVDVVLAVAGDQTKDVIDGGMKAIGVDSPQESLFGSNVIFSILKDIKSAVKDALIHLSSNPKDHYYISGNLLNHLVGISSGTQAIKDIYDDLSKDKEVVLEATVQGTKFAV